MTTQPLPTTSELREELTEFLMCLTYITRLEDGSYEFRLPMIYSWEWKPVILAQPRKDGTFEVFAYNDYGREYFLPINEPQERAIVHFFRSEHLEQTREHGYTFFCSRKDLAITILFFALFLHDLYFARNIAMKEAEDGLDR